MIGMDFTAIDVELANNSRASVCAVGLVRVRSAEIVDEQRWLIRPPAGHDKFLDDRYHVGLHGVTAAMVVNEPRWRDRFPDLLDYVGDDVLVAHNAYSMDEAAITQACQAEGLIAPSWRFICTMELARIALPALGSHSLEQVCLALGIPLHKHHDPLADAHASASIVLALAERERVGDLAELVNIIEDNVPTESVHAPSNGWYSHRAVPREPNMDADQDGLLYGRVVVFSGGSASMTEQEAYDSCAQLGATVKKTVTHKTDVLFVLDSPGVAKRRDAAELRAGGQVIVEMDEGDLQRCIAGATFKSKERERPMTNTELAAARRTPRSHHTQPAKERQHRASADAFAVHRVEVDGHQMVELTCEACGKVWYREPQRGRTPHRCPDCAAAATHQPRPPLPAEPASPAEPALPAEPETSVRAPVIEQPHMEPTQGVLRRLFGRRRR